MNDSDAIAGFLSILICPGTRQKLREATAEERAELNRKAVSGQLRTMGGQAVTASMEGLLVTVSGDRAYPIRGGIPVMLKEEALAIGSGGKQGSESCGQSGDCTKM